MASEDRSPARATEVPGRGKWVGAGAVGLVLTAVAVHHFAHHHPGVAAPARAPTVDVVAATRGPLAPQVSVAGRVEPSAAVVLTAPAAGSITVAVAVGQAVQVLATVSSPALEAAVMSATANLSAQEARLQQATTPPTVLQHQAAEASVQVARGQVAAASSALAAAESPSGPYASAVQPAKSNLECLESSSSPPSVAVSIAGPSSTRVDALAATLSRHLAALPQLQNVSDGAPVGLQRSGSRSTAPRRQPAV